MIGKLVSLNVGKPGTLNYRGSVVSSGFVKKPVSIPLELGRTGLNGDGQADLVHHGGQDKAVCVYPAEHHPYWSTRVGRPIGPADFGENFTVQGLIEPEVCIGDVFEVGSALVEVSQPRQPCYKLGARHGSSNLVLWVQQSGFTGFYFRCLTPGVVGAGDDIRLVKRPEGAVTVAEANRVMHHDRNDITAVKNLLAQEALSESWRRTLEGRSEG